MNTFSLKVIACDKVFFDGRCVQVVLPLHDGLKAIQAHHENMVFPVEVGELRILEEDGNTILGVTGTGFAQMINNRATVIVDTCEYPAEIDLRRAQEAKERAEESVLLWMAALPDCSFVRKIFKNILIAESRDSPNLQPSETSPIPWKFFPVFLKGKQLVHQFP